MKEWDHGSKYDNLTRITTFMILCGLPHIRPSKYNINVYKYIQNVCSERRKQKLRLKREKRKPPTLLYMFGSVSLWVSNAWALCLGPSAALHRWDCEDLWLGPLALHHMTLIWALSVEICVARLDLFVL